MTFWEWLNANPLWALGYIIAMGVTLVACIKAVAAVIATDRKDR